jgi:hypothetical protein
MLQVVFKGLMWLYLDDRGVYWDGGVCFGGIFPCFGEFNMVVCVCVWGGG